MRVTKKIGAKKKEGNVSTKGKFLKFTIIFLSIYLVLAGVMYLIENKNKYDPISEGRNAYMLYFKNTLRDPNSLIIHSETVTGNIFTVDYGAKNGFGAYDRKTCSFEIYGSYIMKIDGVFYGNGTIK